MQRVCGLTRIVFSDIVASIKLPFIFNNIVALMCSLLFLNGLANAPGACRLVLRTSLRRRATYCLAHLPLGWFRVVQSLDVADSKRHSCFVWFIFSPPALPGSRPGKKNFQPGQ